MKWNLLTLLLIFISTPLFGMERGRACGGAGPISCAGESDHTRKDTTSHYSGNAHASRQWNLSRRRRIQAQTKQFPDQTDPIGWGYSQSKGRTANTIRTLPEI